MYAVGSGGNGPLAVARRPKDAVLTGHAEFVGRPAVRDGELQQGRPRDAIKQRAYLGNGANYAFRAHEVHGQADLLRPGEPPQLSVPDYSRPGHAARSYERPHGAQMHESLSPAAYQERYVPWPPDQQGGPRIDYSLQSVRAQRARTGFEHGAVRPSGVTSYAQDFSPHAPHAVLSSHHPGVDSRYTRQTSSPAQANSHVTHDAILQDRRTGPPSRRDVPDPVRFRQEWRPSLQSEEMLRFRNIVPSTPSASPNVQPPDIHRSIPTSPPSSYMSGAYGPGRMKTIADPVSSYMPPLASGSVPSPGEFAPDPAEEASDRLHEHLLDYFERVGFRATAAALQSELSQGSKTIGTKGRPQLARRPTAEERSTVVGPGASAYSAATPQGQSPSTSNLRPPSRPVATPSSATTTSHFGFGEDARRGSDISSWGTPASVTAQLPPTPHLREQIGSGPENFPTPSSSNVDRGFLYEWWNIFWDVYSTQVRAQPRAAGGQSFVRAASAAVDVATQAQPSGQDRDRHLSPTYGAYAPDSRPSYRAGPEQSTRPPIPLRGDSAIATPSVTRSPPDYLASRVQSSGNSDRGRRAAPVQLNDRETRLPESSSAAGGPPRSDAQFSPSSNVPNDYAQTNAPRLQIRRPTERRNDPQTRASPHNAGRSADSAKLSFSPGALQYNPEQLQETADAYQRYRASLVAKQTSQLELAKRQLSDLSGGSDPANSAQAVGRPAAVADVAPVRNESVSMPPPTTSSKRTSTTSTPRSKNATLPAKNAVTSGSAPTYSPAEAEVPDSMLGKRSRDGLNESVIEHGRRNRMKADRPGSPDQAGSAASQPIATQRASTRPGSSGSDHAATSTPTDVEPDMPVSQSVSQRPKLDPRDPLAREAHPTARADDISMEQLNALLSTATDSPVNPNPSNNSGIAGFDDAAFDYDEFLSSFAGGSANYDPTSKAFDVAGK